MRQVVDLTMAALVHHPTPRTSDLPAPLDAQAQVRQLTEALTTRTTIGQAQGILMERYGLETDASFNVLVSLSSNTHRKLRDVAASIVANEEHLPAAI